MYFILLGSFFYFYSKDAIDMDGITKWREPRADSLLTPSKHTYYLPENSSHWEFIYIVLFRQEATFWQHHIAERTGPIITLDDYCEPIQYVLSLLEHAANSGIYNAYESSGAAYNFLMKLYTYIFYSNKKTRYPNQLKMQKNI